MTLPYHPEKNFLLKKEIQTTRVFIILWSLIIAIIYIVSIKNADQKMKDIAVIEAKSHFNKDQAFRFWATTHGGVYVPIDEHTPPSPYLSHIKERDITTPDGKNLTLMNPAYIIRQLNEQFAEQYGVTGHITSLLPLRPENAPDDWERKALETFDQGNKEVFEFLDINHEPYLRIIQPMITTKSCLKCHAHQGYKEGDIRGGVSISLPLNKLLSSKQSSNLISLISLTLLWLLGILGILISKYFLKQGITKQLLAEKTQKKSEQRLIEAQKIAKMGHWELDIVNNKLDWSDEIYRIFELESQNFTISYELFLENIHPEDRDMVNNAYTNSLQTKEPYNIIHRLQMKNGDIKYVNEICSTEFDKNDKPLRSIGTVQDITKQKQEEEKEEVAKITGIVQMAGAMAHELNQPLQSLLISSEFLLDKLSKTDSHYKELNIISKSCQQIGKLTKSIQNFSDNTHYKTKNYVGGKKIVDLESIDNNKSD